MDKSQLRAVLAGALFGIYPLLLSRSKISGNIMAATFSLIVSIFILPFAYNEIKSLATADWRMLIGAGMISAIAMMAMTSFLASGDRTSIGLLIILMIVTQAVVTASYQIYMDKGVSLTRILGFACAAVAVILLNRK